MIDRADAMAWGTSQMPNLQENPLRCLVLGADFSGVDAKVWGTSTTMNPCADLVLDTEFSGGDAKMWGTSPVASEVVGSKPTWQLRLPVAQSGRARTSLRRLVLTTDSDGNDAMEWGSFMGIGSTPIRAGNGSRPDPARRPIGWANPHPAGSRCRVPDGDAMLCVTSLSEDSDHSELSRVRIPAALPSGEVVVVRQLGSRHHFLEERT